MSKDSSKVRKPRSPNYPAIDLQKALELVKALFEKYSRNSVPIDVGLQKGLNYSPKSSKAKQITATLSYYGLIEISGSKERKNIKVTDQAFTILMDKRPESPDRESAIQKAALNPTIYKKIWERFPETMPPDELLEHELIFNFKFNQDSAREFIKMFKQTMEFAKIYESGIIRDEAEEQFGQNSGEAGDSAMIGQRPPESHKSPPKPPPSYEGTPFAVFPTRPTGPRLSFQIKVIKDDDAAITQADIVKLVQYLDVYKGDFPKGEKKVKKDKQLDEPSES